MELCEVCNSGFVPVVIEYGVTEVCSSGFVPAVIEHRTT